MSQELIRELELKDSRFDSLAEAFKKIHWMARRYADGRLSYAPSDFNEAIDAARALGVDLGNPEEGLCARGGRLENSPEK